MKIYSKVILRVLSRSFVSSTHPIGLVFDIDGVLVRGRNVIPEAKLAFQRYLATEEGEIRVPMIFVTNSGSSKPENKAQQLSHQLGVHVKPQHVVMSYTPLKLLTQYHGLHVMAVGQGPVKEIAASLGFNRITGIEDICSSYPDLDVVDVAKREFIEAKSEKHIEDIEGILLLGEPVRWETSLQLVIDILLTKGCLSLMSVSDNKKIVPVLACNMDLQWKSEAQLPRFGHGAFLVALESLYKKIVGEELKYSALVGKPSEITYQYAESLLNIQAKSIYGKNCSQDIKIFCIGDNLCTDIYGANLYRKRSNSNFMSVLVETGVHTEKTKVQEIIRHLHRDFMPLSAADCHPDIIATDIYEVLSKIMK